jgi:hypothetical protein
MDNLNDIIRHFNPEMQIYNIDDSHFLRYGKKVECYDFTELVEYLNRETSIPECGNVYIASDGRAEKLKIFDEMENWLYGGMPLQIGWCSGHNTKLNALEYHRSSEVDVAATPSILLLASITDIRGGKISSDSIEAFFIERGQAVELFSTTLHFSPCPMSDSGFKMGIILPKGTNEPIDLSGSRDVTLWMRNKWLFAHPKAVHLTEKGAYSGITGKMPEIQYKTEKEEVT